MANSLRLRAVGLLVALTLGCGGERVPSQASLVLPASTPAPTATPPPDVTGCNHPGIASLILSPADGAVLRGTAELSLWVVEIRCSITARTCVTTRNSSGAEVNSFCADIGKEKWDTTPYPNGRYTLFAQPACGKSPVCPNGQTVNVEIRN